MERPLHRLPTWRTRSAAYAGSTYAEAEQLRPLVRVDPGRRGVMRARRLDVVDEYVEDGRAAVYSSRGMVVLLSELATTAWSVLGDDWLPSRRTWPRRWSRSSATRAEGDAGRLTEDALRSLGRAGPRRVEDVEPASDPA